MMNFLSAAEDLMPESANTQSIDAVETAIMNIFNSIQSFAIVIALLFSAFELIKFFIASGQEKMQHLKTLGMTLFGVVILVLLPSVLKFILSFF